MSDNTKIEWCDATVNAVNGCSVVSPGCTNCYAMKLAGTRLRNHPSRAGLTIDTKAGPVWNGITKLSEKALMQPLRWKRPRRIFWNAHGDLFHDSVPDEWIDRCFAVMALTPQHIHQVLTKRPERMRAWCESRPRDTVYENMRVLANSAAGRDQIMIRVDWPLPNVWLGTSVEDQTRADERIPHLLATPSAVRFLSCEPLLGPIDLNAVPWGVAGYPMEGALPTPGEPDDFRYWHHRIQGIAWVIVGGESGPGARPMHPDWARSLRDQCADAGVPFFFKQWGEHIAHPAPDATWKDGTPVAVELEPMRFVRVGKKAAGRLLDGAEHSGMPS